MARVISRAAWIAVGAALVLAQDSKPPSLLEAIENVQNDFDGAMARAHATYSDRQKALAVDSVLARLIGEKRDKQNLNEHTVRDLLEEVKRFGQGDVFSREDRLRLERDVADVKYRLAHELDVFRGYKGMAHP